LAENDINPFLGGMRGISMKKTIYSILIISLVVGFVLIIMDGLNRDDFKVPSRFEKVIVDLNEQFGTDVLLFTKELNVPSTVEFFIQSDDESPKNVKIVSESEILGLYAREVDFTVGKLTGDARIAGTFTMDKGRYSVYVTSDKAVGKLVVGLQETAKEPSDFERLYKIHNGELNNPPEGYVEVFSTHLTEKSWKDEVIYSLSLDATRNIGLSVYTSAKQGSVSVDFIGQSSNFMGLIHPQLNRICDQLETTLSPGEYQIKLTCENADGQLYVFLKQ